MKIKFKEKTLYTSLVLGLTYIGIGIYNLIIDVNLRWSNYVFLLVGLLFVGLYIYNVINQYLTIENGIIKKNILFGLKNQINMSDINSIKKSVGGYVLKSETTELKINILFIGKKSLVKLNEVLDGLNLPASKTSSPNMIQN